MILDSGQVEVSHTTGSRLPLCSATPTVISLAAKHHSPIVHYQITLLGDMGITVWWWNGLKMNLQPFDCCCQGDHSFSTMTFHDFSMTKKWISMTYRHSIFFWNKIHDHTAWNKTPLCYQTTNRNTGKSEGQTMNNVHFYKKFQDIIIIFHNFPWPWLFSMTFQAWKMVILNSMTFHDFPGRVVTLCCHTISFCLTV